MESKNFKEENESVLLTKHVFEKLLDKIIEKFKSIHDIDEYKDSQLYGFGSYDAEKPNLKSDFEYILKGYVNGKYLYNKSREIATGKPKVRISKEYKSVFLNYIGYNNIIDFVAKEITDTSEGSSQEELLQDNTNTEKFYYVMYFYGEDKKMTKGQMIINSDWKTYDMIFVYQSSTNKPIIYNLYGSIKQDNNFVYFDSKYFFDGRKNEASKFVFYIGKASRYNLPILMGTYSAYDKYDQGIAGKTILVQYNTKAEMEEESLSTKFDPLISQELIKQRFIIPSKLPKKLTQLSSDSPYASIFGALPNDYKATFDFNDSPVELSFKIQENHYNIISTLESIEILNDRLSILDKGRILHLHFDLTGVFKMQTVSIYLKINELLGAKKTVGQYSGIDIFNNVASGDVLLEILHTTEDRTVLRKAQ